MAPNFLTVETRMQAAAATVWRCLTAPEHIAQWNQASADWHCPEAENDLQPGGRFRYRMAARDGSFAFDLTGEFDAVTPEQHLAYHLDDGRRVRVDLRTEADGSVTVTQAFEPEATHPLALQREGWQAILDSFAQHVAVQSS